MLAERLDQINGRVAFWTIAAITLVCEAAFLVTIPLPRVDGQLVGSDGVVYYSYLPTVLVDGDLDFTDEYQALAGRSPGQLEFLLSHKARSGHTGNPLPFGTALFWSPFFLVSHSAELILQRCGVEIDPGGCGPLAQAGTLFGSILYGGAALGLLFLFVRQYEPDAVALIASVLIVLAGNLIYYMTAEPSMSHAVSAFVVCLLFFAWCRLREREGVRPFLIYGLIGALAALVRIQDGILLAIPLLGSVGRGETLVPRQDWKRTAKRLTYALAGGLLSLALFSPQLLLWRRMFDREEALPYAQNGPPWWLDPEFRALFFSPARGLFVWHPVFLLAVIGLALALLKHRKSTALCLLGLAVQSWLIASWAWSQGQAFGGRMFIACAPCFALGLARLIETVRQRSSWKPVVIGGGLLIAWNFLLFVEYRVELATKATLPTWYDVTVRPVTFLLDRILG